MKKTLLLNAILLVGWFGAFAQSIYPILQTAKPERGVYLTFREFQHNAPSIKADFTLKPRSKNKQFWLGGSDYDLVFTDPNSTLEAKKIWGVSTGDSVYVNVANFQANKGFIKFLGMGRYCYMKGVASLSQGDYKALPGGAIKGGTGGIPYDAAFILNINNGNFFMLDKFLMEKVLEKDDELLTAYTNEKKQKDPEVILSYIKRYNERHTDEIGVREKLAQLTIYRREKKQQPAPVTIVSSDSVQFALTPSDYRVFYLKKGMVTLCIGKQCETFSLSIDEVTYLECTYKAGETRAELLIRPKKEGEFYLREIEFGNEKKNASTSP